jgi:hypothetical protein
VVDDLKVSDFAIGDSFEVQAGDAVHALVVEDVKELPRAARDAGSFRLLFRGPAQPLLPQATYTLKCSRRSDDIFIVPVSADADAVRYEAIFA